MTTATRTLPPHECRNDLRDVVPAAADGDQNAWNELVARYAGLIWSVTRGFRFNDEDAADVVQNTWLQLTTRLGAIRTPEALPKWLATTARNESLKLIRGRRDQATPPEDLDRASDERGPAEHLMYREMLQALRSAMNVLPQRDARLLLLLMKDSRPHYAEIASALGMPIGSVGPLRSRALDRLRVQLAVVDVTSPTG